MMNISVDHEELAALIGEFASSGMKTLHLRSPDIEILLSMDGQVGPLSGGPAALSTPTVTATTPPTGERTSPSTPPLSTTAQVEIPEGALIVSAPTLGTFYRSPKPGAAAYVEVGQVVDVGAELCLIEVMKLFTAVRAEGRGRVVAVLAADGTMVEAGQPLFALGDA